MSRTVLLVRHTDVARAWRGRCYGRSDAGLSRAGIAQVREIAPELAAWRPELIVHSGLRRSRTLAEAVARRSGMAAMPDAAWAERDFGTWEGRSWNAIYRETGSAMDGMIDDPDGFRPGGGETTLELAARVCAAAARLPARRILIVTHGGPIAALRGTLAGHPPTTWPGLIPPTGGVIELRLD